MKGSKSISAIHKQTRNRNSNANLLDMIDNKEDVSSQSKQENKDNINNIISGSLPPSGQPSSGVINKRIRAEDTANNIQTKPSCSSDTNSTNPLPNNSSLENASSCNNLSSILSKPQFSYSYSTQQSKPRPEHPLPLISFPSTRGNNDPDNEIVTPTLTISENAGSGKLCGRISTTKELLWDDKIFASVLGDGGDNFQITSKNTQHSGKGGSDGWIASDRAKIPFYNRVPKPSHSAKKLAKPYSILIPPNSANNSYSKSYSTAAERGRRSSREIGRISPSATTTPTPTTISSSASNNIDNKVVNKPKRNKTARAETGLLRKGLSTNNYTLSSPVPNTFNSSSSSNTTNTKRGLLFFSDVKKVANNISTTKRKVGINRGEGWNDEEISEERHGQQQQSSFNGSSSGLRLMSGESGQWRNWKVLNGGTTHLNKSMSSLSKKLNERVQVIRTAEEREESPDSLRMDGLGLKLFPYIGGGEGPCIKLLSLQKNLISHLENTPSHLNHLVVLDLYSNRIERLTGLLGFTSLRVLLLGKNRIRRIEGLENLKRLEILDLHGNQLRYVDNLGVLSSLRILNLAGNMLRSIRNLGPAHGSTTLIELNLKRNRIRNLDGLVKAPNLKKLLLATNDLQSFNSLLPLRKLSSLEELLLEPNPLTSVSDYRHQLLTMLPWLQCMDRVGITEIMRSEARLWQKRKLAEEEERRKEEVQLRTAALSPTGGPPNSREQAIYQAQRRWETVKKNFVKNTNSKPTNPSSPSLFLMSGANENGTFGKEQEDKIGSPCGGPVRSEIDDEAYDDLNSHFRSKSRLQTFSHEANEQGAAVTGNSSKESKSDNLLVLLEYPGGEVKLNLAHLDLDQHQQPNTIRSSSSSSRTSRSKNMLVSSGKGNENNIKRMPMPLAAEEPCPPSMINDLRPSLPQNPKDYVDTNSSDLVSTKQVHDQHRLGERKKEEVGLHGFSYDCQSQVEDQEIGVATQPRQKSQMKKTNCGDKVQLLSSKPHDDHDIGDDIDEGHSQGEYYQNYHSQMDSSIITNIIKEVKSTQSPPTDGCQPQWMMLTQILGDAGNEDDSKGHVKITPQFFNEYKDNSAETTFSPAPQPTKANNHPLVREKAIAVVRPLLRERNLDETIIIPPQSATNSPNNFLHPQSTPSSLLSSTTVFVPNEVSSRKHKDDDDAAHKQIKLGVENVTSFLNRENTNNNCDNKLPQNNNEVVVSLSDLQQCSSTLTYRNPNHNFSSAKLIVDTLPAAASTCKKAKPEKKKQIFAFDDEDEGNDIFPTDTNQLPSISSPSDPDRDKIIQSNKSEIMTRGSDLSNVNKATSSTFSTTTLLVKEELESVTPRNIMLRQNFSTCLSNSCSSSRNSGAEGETTCPTFTFETLVQQSINKEKETRIINNNLTAAAAAATQEEVTTFSSTTTLPTSANILQASTAISLPTTIANVNVPQQQQQISTVPTTESGRNSHVKPSLRKLRSVSFDGRLLSSSGGGGGGVGVGIGGVCGGGSDDEHYDVDDDDTCSSTTGTGGSNTTIATSSDVSNRLGFSKKQLFPSYTRTKSQRLNKLVRGDRPTRAQSSSSLNTITTRAKSGTLSSFNQNMTVSSSSGGVNRIGQGGNISGDIRGNKPLRRCESAAVVGSSTSGGGTCPLENNGNNSSPAPLKRQGIDYLVEIDGKNLSIYGQGALKHTLTGFSGSVTCSITTAKFHYISYDTIIPFFGKMKQIYPFLEHVQFRANNIETLSQLNALSDLQGLTSLHIAKEGNPLVSQDTSWVHYANYRLSHWGLKNVNGKEVSSEYRGGQTGSTAKCFESLGFLALSCLPQTALTPLARKLHMLHCFCCCSPSSSSDESGKGGKFSGGKPIGGGNGGGVRTTSPLPQDQSSSSGNICTSWDDDPVLLDVIGKEALVYCPSPIMRRELSPPTNSTTPMCEQETSSSHSRKHTSSTSKRDNDSKKRLQASTLNDIVESGVDVLEKLDRLEKVWPSLMRDMIQEILLDYKFMDNYMKKELKKCQDIATLALHKGHNTNN